MPTLDWIGKQAVVNHDKDVPFRLLKRDVKLSLGDSENLLIKGDNLEALKALMPYYVGKVKCIYIDPPYNTGTENWVYNDAVNSPEMRSWLGRVVGREDDDLSRHDKWLCMMYPRLKLLWDLLADDGVIFISIDYNEQHHLICMMNEIFKGCFKDSVVIRRGAKNVQAQFETIDSLNNGYESIVVYSKSRDYRFQKLYMELEEEKPGSWNNHWRGTDRPTMRYKLFGITPPEGQWRWGEPRSKKAIQNYEMLLSDLKKQGKAVTQENIDEWYLARVEETSSEEIDLLRLSDNKKPEHYIQPTSSKLLSNLWTDLKPNGSSQLKQVFGKKVFDTPKSVDLIKRIVKWMTKDDKEAVILDSFAGSGATGHAVLEVNREDKGKRRFILVEMEDAIAKDITAERLKKVVNGYASNEGEEKGLGGGFQFMRLDTTLFDKDGKLSEPVTYLDLARYVFFTETRKDLNEKNLKKPYVGTNSDTDYFLFFAERGKNTFTREHLQKLTKSEHHRVVYADRCLLSDALLRKERITFKQIPYQVRVY